MYEVLFDHFLTRFEVLVFLVVAASVVGGIYWVWQSRLEILKQELARLRNEMGILEAQVRDAEKSSAFRHSNLLSGLSFISTKGVETLGGLEESQIVLREKQGLIITKAQDLLQHARNALDISDPEPADPPKELLNVKGLVEMVLREFYSYAQSKGVTLLTNLTDVEPTLLNRELTLQTLRNLIHNAIKYSRPGGTVEIILDIEG